MRRRLCCFAIWAVLFMVLAMTPGCSQYQAGGLLHPQIDTVFVAPVTNATDTSELAAQLRRFVSAELMRDGSVRITAREEADTVLSLRVEKYNLSRSASAKIREPAVAEDEGDEYQTSIYRADIQVKMKVSIPDRQEPVLDWEVVEDKALFTRFPDMTESRRAGLRQAANNVARKIVYRFTEAW